MLTLTLSLKLGWKRPRRDSEPLPGSGGPGDAATDFAETHSAPELQVGFARADALDEGTEDRLEVTGRTGSWTRTGPPARGRA